MPVDAVLSIGPLPALETLPVGAPPSDGGAFSRELYNGSKTAADEKSAPARSESTPNRADKKELTKHNATSKHGATKKPKDDEKASEASQSSPNDAGDLNHGNDEISAENTNEITGAEELANVENPLESDDDLDSVLIAIDPSLVPAIVPVSLPTAIEDAGADVKLQSKSAIDEIIPAAKEIDSLASPTAPLPLPTAEVVKTEEPTDGSVESVVPTPVVLDDALDNQSLQAATAIAEAKDSEEPELKPHFLGAKGEDEDDKTEESDPASNQARVRRALPSQVERATRGDISELVGKVQRKSDGSEEGTFSAALAATGTDSVTEALEQIALTELSQKSDEKDDVDPAASQAGAATDRPLIKQDEVPANLSTNHAHGVTSSRFHPTLSGHDTPLATHARPLEVDTARFLQRVTRAFAAAEARGGGELRLRLSPPELGSLQLEIGVKAGVLTARLETETSAAQSILLDNLPQLKERLAEQGMHIERFDVNVSGRNPGNAPDFSQNERERRDPPWRPPTESSRPTNSIGPRRDTWDGDGLNVIV